MWCLRASTWTWLQGRSSRSWSQRRWRDHDGSDSIHSDQGSNNREPKNEERESTEHSSTYRQKERKEQVMQTKANRQQLSASYDWYQQMRETQPVSFDPNLHSWHVFRYADVARVLSDHATFSSDESRYLPAEFRNATPISSSMLRMDPPRHRKLTATATRWSS
jgi:hypothetical protein